MSIALSPVMPMAEQPPDSPPTVTVRMDADLVQLARIVCALTPGRGNKQTKLVDYLDSIVRGRITADHAAVMARVAREQQSSRGSKRKPPPPGQSS